MPQPGYSNMTTRDSLELASLATSSQRSSQDGDRSSSSAGPPSSRNLSLLSGDDPLDPSPTDAGARPGHGRTYSVSSAFDFAANLFPLSSTAAGYTALGAPASGPLDPSHALSGPGGGAAGGSLERHKSLTYLNGLSLVIGLIIGSGIFSSPAELNRNAGSPGASMVVWAVAGLLAWTGAASYAELGGAIPLNGGSQVYLTKIFGEWAGFLFTWCAVIVLKPGSAALIAIIFGEYCVRAVVGPDALDVSVWLNKGVAVAALVMVTLLNCVSTKLGTRSADVFMFLKFLALLGVTITGVVVAVTGFSWKGDASEEWKTQGWFDGTTSDISRWAVALYAGLWAYDGWDNVNYVAGEFINPSRDIPRTIHTSLFLVIIAYLLANVSYTLVLPQSTITSSNTIAVTFGSKVFGRVGSLILALAVSGSCFGALNATTFTSGRLIYAAAKEGYLPSLFGHLGLGRSHKAIRLGQSGSSGSAYASTPTLGGTSGWWRFAAARRSPAQALAFLVADEDAGLFFTPINAMLLNAALATAYIAVGQFDSLLTFYGVAGYSFYFLTVLGLIVLRVREPELDRPYRVWIATPIVFCCVSLFLLSRAMFVKPGQAVIVAAFVGAGVPVYWLRVRRNNKRRRRGGGGKIGPEEERGVGWKFWKRWWRD